jgi:hypothetical protein
MGSENSLGSISENTSDRVSKNYPSPKHLASQCCQSGTTLGTAETVLFLMGENGDLAWATTLPTYYEGFRAHVVNCEKDKCRMDLECH